MFSMLKMDMRRLVKNKYFYLSIIVFIVFMGICIYMQNNEQIIRGYKDLPKEQYVGFQFTINYHLTSILHFIYGFGLKYSMFVFGIFMAVFICDEYNSGFIKNTCMMYKNRNMIVLNKFLIIVLMSVFVSLLTYLSCHLFGYLFVKDFVLGHFNEIISYLGMMTVVNIAYLSLILLIGTITRNKTVCIVIVLLITLGFTYALLQTVFNTIDLSYGIRYTLSHVLMTLPMLYDKTESFHNLIMSGVFILIYNLVSMIYINKKDI